MGDLSSINFKKSFAINVQHNDRTLPPSYLIGNDKEVNRNAAEALALKQEMINRAFEKYTARTGQKPQAKNYEWSAVVNLKPSSTMQDLENLAQHLQDKYGLQCYQLAIHRDEGHINEKGEKVINHHAHIELITLDRETGVNNFKRSMITRQVLRDMQSEVAEILGMQRGIDKRTSKVKRIEPRIYAKMKEQEKNVKSKHEHEHELSEVKFKANQDILKYKESKDDEIIGLQTDLNKANALIEQFRVNEMKNKGFDKAAFDNLNNFKKSIREALKLGENITDEQIKQRLNEILLQAQENKKLREQTERDKETITELRNILADLRDKEPAKTAENQKNNENLYTAEQIKNLFDFEYELNQQANTIDKDIKEFDKKENVLLPDAKQRKIKEIGVNTSNLLDKIAKNTHLENLFSFENCKEKVQKAIKWLKDKGLSLTKTQNTGLSI